VSDAWEDKGLLEGKDGERSLLDEEPQPRVARA
jgi:hypothetical protein